MFGAVYGDIVGSSHEGFKGRLKTTEFPLIDKYSRFTDDTVMTIAVADSITNAKPIISTFHEYYNFYPDAGYGAAFKTWCRNKSYTQLGSYGNGAAMRVSPCAYVSNELKDCLYHARNVTDITHGHSEGLLGAAAVTTAIYYARMGVSIDEIKRLVMEMSGYDLDRSLEDIRPNYKFDSTCQGSVPEAIICFLESDSWVSAVRNAVSLGGDADTQAAIAGSIAEAFYGIPEYIHSLIYPYIPRKFCAVIENFHEKYNLKPRKG